MRVSLQPAYVLHSRPYRDSSLLLETLTPEYGRIGLVARGARGPTRRGSRAVLLQPFVPLLLSFSGRGELKTLTAREAVGKPIALRGERMFSGLYVNELLVRLLHRHDPHPQLFALYARTLEALQGQEALDETLRGFELALLDELGYSFDLTLDGRSGEAVQAELWYQYHPEFGMVATAANHDPSRPAYVGADLLRLSRGEFGGEARLAAKRLLRQALAIHLGEAPLKSRELFRGSIRSLDGQPASRPDDREKR